MSLMQAKNSISKIEQERETLSIVLAFLLKISSNNVKILTNIIRVVYNKSIKF